MESHVFLACSRRINTYPVKAPTTPKPTKSTGEKVEGLMGSPVAVNCRGMFKTAGSGKEAENVGRLFARRASLTALDGVAEALCITVRPFERTTFAASPNRRSVPKVAMLNTISLSRSKSFILTEVRSLERRAMATSLMYMIQPPTFWLLAFHDKDTVDDEVVDTFRLVGGAASLGDVPVILMDAV